MLKSIPARQFLLLVLLLFAALVVGTIHTKRPSIDEGWFSSPVANILHHGFMGTTVIEEAGTPYHGINQHTYWIPPLSFLFNAAWSGVFGLDLISLRYAALFWGLISAIALYFFALKISRSEPVALLSVVVMCSSYFLVQAAADVRMDMMCQSLMMVGLAVYLQLRERHLMWAIFASESCIMLSGMTHPHGIIGFVALHAFILANDRKRIDWRILLLAVLPYLVGAIAWGTYIARDFTDFKAQFLSNATDRFGGTDVWHLLDQELKLRYLENYGFDPQGRVFSRLKGYVLVVYVLSLFACVLERTIRQNRQLMLVAAILVFTLLFLVLQPNKACFYLVTPLPFLSILVATAAVRFSRGRGRAIVSLLFAGFVALQIGSSLNTIRLDILDRDFLALRPLLDKYHPARIDGSAEFQFLTGFSGAVTDDPNLGYLSGKTPDMVILDHRYLELAAMSQDQTLNAYRRALLEGMRLVGHNDLYQVYARIPPAMVEEPGHP